MNFLYDKSSLACVADTLKRLYRASANLLDCSQSPIFPCDRRDRARLTVNGGHLDFQSYRGGGRRGL